MGIFGSKDSSGNPGNRKIPVDQSNQMTQLDKAKLEVKRGKNRISKFSKKLEQQIVKLDLDARKYLKSGNKKKALYTIKLKKLKIKSMENVETQILSLEKVLLEIETTEMTQESLKAVQNGTNALNEMHRIMSVEDVEQILSDNEEALDDANEIANLIAGAGGSFDVVDEDELEAELQALNGNVNKNNSNVLILKMPNVPTHKVEQSEKDVDEKSEKKRVLVTS
jgi:charged multivesicular body protein 6